MTSAPIEMVRIWYLRFHFSVRNLSETYQYKITNYFTVCRFFNFLFIAAGNLGFTEFSAAISYLQHELNWRTNYAE